MIKTTLSFAVLALLAFAGTASAAGAAAPEDGNILDLAKPVFDAVMAGNYWLGAAAALVLLVAATRRYGAKWFPRALGWVNSSWGTPVAVLLASFGGAMATALAAGSGPSLAMVKVAFGIAITAAGGYKLVKELAVPLLTKLRDKLPAWARPLVDVLLWAFQRDPVAKAEAAGDAAVADKPSTGIAGVVGEPRKWPPQ
jgi:hypothetical protein